MTKQTEKPAKEKVQETHIDLVIHSHTKKSHKNKYFIEIYPIYIHQGILIFNYIFCVFILFLY